MKTFILSLCWEKLISWLSTHIQEEQKNGGKGKRRGEKICCCQINRALGAPGRPVATVIYCYAPPPEHL